MHRLKRVILKTKKRIFSEFSGNNRSHLKGEGSSFEEIRAYLYGDDRRKIDWKTSAKMQELYVRVYNEEREINVVVAVMLNGNLYFGKKHKLLLEIATLLGHSAIKNGDLFSGAILSEVDRKINPSGKKLYILEKFLKNISGYDLLNLKEDYQKDIEFLRKHIKKRSLLFLIGDFLEKIDLSSISKKHEIVLIIVRDKDEENPKFKGDVTLVDPVTKEELRATINEDFFKTYIENYKKNDSLLVEHLNSQGVVYVKIYSDEDPFFKLSKLFGN